MGDKISSSRHLLRSDLEQPLVQKMDDRQEGVSKQNTSKQNTSKQNTSITPAVQEHLEKFNITIDELNPSLRTCIEQKERYREEARLERLAKGDNRTEEEVIRDMKRQREERCAAQQPQREKAEEGKTSCCLPCCVGNEGDNNGDRKEEEEKDGLSLGDKCAKWLCCIPCFGCWCNDRNDCNLWCCYRKCVRKCMMGTIIYGVCCCGFGMEFCCPCCINDGEIADIPCQEMAYLACKDCCSEDNCCCEQFNVWCGLCDCACRKCQEYWTESSVERRRCHRCKFWPCCK